MPSLSVICDSRRHCGACRAAGEEGEKFRAGLAKHYTLPAGWPACPHGIGPDVPPPPPAPKPYPGAVPMTVRKTCRGMAVEEPPPATAKQVASYLAALATARRVPVEVTAEREATCTTCSYARWSRTADAPWCSICGCKVGGATKYLLKKLTEVEENLPAWGCHHPRRDKGEGWQR